MNDKLLRELQTMGKGWFIVKLAEERGFAIPGESMRNSTSDPSLTTKTNAFIRTQLHHNEMLEFVVATFNDRISIEGSRYNNADIKWFANKLLANI